MKKAFIFISLISLINCSWTNPYTPAELNRELADSENFLGYQPIDPLPVQKVKIYDSPTNQVVEKYWAEIKDRDIVQGLLPLQSAQVSVSKSDASGKTSYLTASLSGEIGIYTVIMDYMKYRIEDVLDNNTSNFLGNGKVGVGLRIKAIVKTSRANLNLGSLIGIGLEAKGGNLRGGISVDVIGIDSADVTNLIPLTSEIDQTSIQSALQALASIKAKIYDKETKLTPHLVAIQQSEPGNVQQIKKIATNHYLVGKSKAVSLLKRKSEILKYVSPNNIFNKGKWIKLIGKTNLTDSEKKDLMKFNDLNSVSNRLDIDAGMNGSIINKIYENLLNQ